MACAYLRFKGLEAAASYNLEVLWAVH